MRFPVVIFDLDGTLIDSGRMILESFRHATSDVLGRQVPEEEILTAVAASTLHEQMRLLDEERVEELVHSYRAHNRPLHTRLDACPGIEGVLEHLREERRRLGIATSKHHATVRLAFETLAIEGFFDAVVAYEDTQRHKPHPDPVLRALELLRARPEQAAYVGDAPVDVQAARAAGVFSVAVTWGGMHSEEGLRAAGPDALVHDAEELLGVL
jgi:pyrophosphatase PpaX